jgi:hypothetical protein
VLRYFFLRVFGLEGLNADLSSGHPVLMIIDDPELRKYRENTIA